MPSPIRHTLILLVLLLGAGCAGATKTELFDPAPAGADTPAESDKEEAPPADEAPAEDDAT